MGLPVIDSPLDLTPAQFVEEAHKRGFKFERSGHYWRRDSKGTDCGCPIGATYFLTGIAYAEFQGQRAFIPPNILIRVLNEKPRGYTAGVLRGFDGLELYKDADDLMRKGYAWGKEVARLAFNKPETEHGQKAHGPRGPKRKKPNKPQSLFDQ
jgi:hypothetical protein